MSTLRLPLRSTEGTEFSALSERMLHLLVLRIAMAAIVVAWAGVRPEALGVPLGALVAGSASYVAVAVAGEWLRRAARRRGFAFLSLLLLVDGVYLAWAMYATGGTQSSLRFLVFLHLVAVSLLASYRTGLKVALWHSLLLFVVLYAQAAQLVPPVDVLPGRGIEFDRMPVLNVTSFWLFALATSAFSAMNERELRQRRADLEALVELGARLDDVADPTRQSQIVLDGVIDRFGFGRGLVLGASEGRTVVLAAHGTAAVPTLAVATDAAVAAAWERRELLVFSRLDANANPMLAVAMPGARQLLVAPMIADGEPVGAIVVEQGRRSVLGVSRRLASILGQLGAIAALNLRNAVLLRSVQDLAERDSLTGAANRRMFQMSLERVLATTRGRPALQQAVSTVLFIDLDDFKVVNDTLGHGAGDGLLVAVIERISGSVREGDLVARLGGDEFAILTDDAPDLKRSMAMAERLVRELRAPYLIDGHHVSVTASIGIASAIDGTETAADLVRNADVAMYLAKANGKAGFAIFDPGMHAAIRERHELGAQLQSAVELGQLRLVYQPIVSLTTGRAAGVEALVRWDHPERGTVPPGDFIEIAEENGAILPIGRWVLREACRQARRWATEESAAPLFLCVNVSAREIQQPDFVESVRTTLEAESFDPLRLRIEITETALLKATPATVATLESVRALGVHVVIDDFGTGYFSLSHLRQFPVDTLKIASEFVQTPGHDAKSAALAGAIVAMSDSLRITTVAEGIEDAEQAARMRDLGCTYGQGYFFARPMAGDLIAPLAPDADVITEHGERRASGPSPIRHQRVASTGTVVPRFVNPAGETGIA
ncbi:MAG TPA: EAL domain-containing protein [Candidatus Deferrimicrobium sp.]|nr:EAL domain-containing protein [Candidatus Deferrimicrobium sp.]